MWTTSRWIRKVGAAAVMALAGLSASILAPAPASATEPTVAQFHRPIVGIETGRSH
jgi:hypothetical protein